MNTNMLFPLAVTALAVATATALVATSPLPDAEAAPRIVDLPAVVVHPAAEDAACYQTHRIVDLDVVVVHPEAGDPALSVAAATRRIDCLSC